MEKYSDNIAKLKKINLSFISIPDKKSNFSELKARSIYLGNGARLLFSNEKKAKKFLAQTNEFLNGCYQELNQIYISTFAEYRNLWFVIDFEQIIEERFEMSRKYFNKLYRNNHTENANYFIFHNFQKLAEELRIIITRLIEYLTLQKNYSRINILYTLKLRIDNICNALATHGHSPGKINDIDTDE